MIADTPMDPPVSDVDKIEEQKENGPFFHCHLYDTEVVHKIAQFFLPGLATACVDNTTGDIFRSPGSVAAVVRKEMIDYLTRRSESFVAEHIVLEGGSETEASHVPYDIISDFIDDFATSKRNLFSRVSGWLLSERREDNIDDFAQEMEMSGFWLTDHREGIAQTLLKNVDFKNSSHCEMKYQTERELAEHALSCGYRTMNCENEGCNAVFCANQFENHDSVCPFKIIPCEQNCSESIMRREMDRHCITVCPMKLVNCPFHVVGCLSDVHQFEVRQHHLDNVSSHLMYILRSIYKEASPDDLKPRAQQIQQLSSRLSEARNARSLTNMVKEIDAKLGPLEIKPKNVSDSESDKEKALEEAETKEKQETIDLKIDSLEQTAREAEVLVDNVMVEEAVGKVSEAEIADNVNEEGELKAQKLLEIGEFIKEGDNSSASDLSERTETKAPEVVVMDEDREEEEEEEESEETIHLRTNETRGLEIEVSDVIDEENRETKKSTEAPSRIVMDKEDDEEGTETVSLKAQISDEAEALSKSTEGFSIEQAKTVPNMS
uniref:TNF receptor-associated factor 6 n=1 Tax=Noccaea caerulescens TaxID=107243 RepID=A0A1J3JFT8_NOCCA